MRVWAPDSRIVHMQPASITMSNEVANEKIKQSRRCIFKVPKAYITVASTDHDDGIVIVEPGVQLTEHIFRQYLSSHLAKDMWAIHKQIQPIVQRPACKFTFVCSEGHKCVVILVKNTAPYCQICCAECLKALMDPIGFKTVSMPQRKRIFAPSYLSMTLEEMWDGPLPKPVKLTRDFAGRVTVHFADVAREEDAEEQE